MISPPILFTIGYFLVGMLTALYGASHEKRKQMNEMAFEMEQLSEEEKVVMRIAVIIVDVLLWPISISQMRNIK